MIDLVQELETRNTPDGRYNELIREAKAGEFHDYKNKKYTCGKAAFVILVANNYPELSDIAEEFKKGVYDEVPDEEDKELMRKDLKAEGFSDEMIERMFGL